MATLVFAVLIVASLVLAFIAKRGHKVTDLREFFIASRQFGGLLLFFLAVGEIYSIGTMIGFPGGIYAKGSTYGIWFLGYILLAYPVGYFINPWIWRAGHTYNAVTMPDIFKGHFGSRALELTVTITAIIFMIPWGQLQFTGLIVALNGLGWHINSLALTVIAAALAFSYIAISGVRASAYVAIIKDILMILSIVVTGVAAGSAMGVATIFHTASLHVQSRMTLREQYFAMSTIAFQCLGFYMSPWSIPNLFTARSEQTIRKTQIFMPLYMLMYPFLVVAAYYELARPTHIAAANEAFMAAAVHLLPGWLLGMVAAGASLSGLIVLAGISLAIGPLVSRNLLSRVPEQKQRGGARIVIVAYLAISILFTLATPTLMLTLINTSYYGTTQFFPGMMAVIFFRRANPIAIATGIIVADVLAISLYVMKISLGGFNIGLVCLLINIAIVVIGSLLTKSRVALTPIAERRLLQEPVS